MKTKFSNRRPLTDDEEAEIQRMIASDVEAPELTDEQIAQRKPFAEACPELMESIKRARGRPRVESAKEAVTLRLSPQTIQRFKQRGGNWRAQMCATLERAAKQA